MNQTNHFKKCLNNICVLTSYYLEWVDSFVNLSGTYLAIPRDNNVYFYNVASFTECLHVKKTLIIFAKIFD